MQFFWLQSNSFIDKLGFFSITYSTNGLPNSFIIWSILPNHTLRVASVDLFENGPARRHCQCRRRWRRCQYVVGAWLEGLELWTLEVERQASF